MPSSAAPVELVISRFGPGARFEGEFVGALQRLDVLGSLLVLDALFVQTDATTGDVAAFDACGADLRATLVDLLDFRLDPAARARATREALADESGGVPGATVREVADALEPGGALVAVLVEHGGAEGLDEAVARAGGSLLVHADVDATRLADVPAQLRTAAARR
jgi:hypothetical protein